MLNFNLDWKPYTFPWEGAEISVELKTITTEQMLVLAPYLGMNWAKMEMTKEEVSRQVYEVQKATLPFVNDVIRNIKGINVNGQPITPEHLCTESVFGTLLYHFVNEAYLQSLPDKPGSKSEKNLP